ncbi:MAG TPA: class I SAM-dependent methyltransferase [Thermoanaerobaculia bacterium]|nr:class I SAM-dependent methyltransferase [Thermoanaerobaculia bacterium]
MTSEQPGAPKILTAPYYERLNDLERRHWWCRSVRRAALALVEPAMCAGAVVLDAGCGAGGLLEAVAARWPNIRAIGVDVSGDALSYARARGLRGLAFGSATELPVAAESVDVLFSNDVLQHLPEREDERAVIEARRVLKADGILSIRASFGVDRSGGASRSPATRGLHRQYRLEEIEDLARRNGFRVERHLVLHALPRLLAGLTSSKHGSAQDSGGGLSTTVPAAPVNALMGLYARVEDFVAMRVPFALPSGDTQILMARKAS